MQINSFPANVVLTLRTGWNLARISVCQQTKYNNEPAIFKIFILDIVVAKYIIVYFSIPNRASVRLCYKAGMYVSYLVENIYFIARVTTTL